jgi:CRISPR/Cas system type I-B associated protein Csh2 (Cas7 group RAMP superfamily)
MQGRRERVEVATADGRGLRRGLAFELHRTPAAVAWIRLRVKGPVDPTVRACVAGVGGCVCGMWAARLTCIVTQSLGLGRGCSTSATRRSRDTPSRQTVLPTAVAVAVAGIVVMAVMMQCGFSDE